MPEPFFRDCTGIDEEELREVLALVAATDVVELEVSVGGSHILLRRELDAAQSAEPLPAAEAAAEAEEPGADGAEHLAITSPLVGIFRPSVRLGDAITPGQLLGAVEAMGMPTSVDAPRGGVVEELLALDGSPVEFGQPLLVLRRAEAESRP